jgi:glycosyltransferase involved in cell wall biosynthesis
MNRGNLDTDFANAAIVPARAGSGARICIVTGELEGPYLNGGIGTTNRALAIVLRSLGYEVDILYTNVERGTPFCFRGKFADYVEAYRDLGIRLVCIDHRGERRDGLARSYLAMRHLLSERYQLAFFDDFEGTGFYSALARRTGNPLMRETRICVTTHSSFEWLLNVGQPVRTTFDTIPLLEMERRSVELADSVRAPSAYILRKYRSFGWKIPENSIVLPNFVSGGGNQVAARKRVPVDEIVFFGRLETRKGLDIFCRAIDRLKYKLSGKAVTFLGRSTPETARHLLLRASAWPFPVRLLDNYDRDQALRYLKGDGRLAVMTPVEDNSPSTILECLEEGIPFIASSGSGGVELLDEEAQHANTFEPTVDRLCQKLIETLSEGGSIARASFDQGDLRLTFSRWLAELLNSPASQSAKRRTREKSHIPLLVVVIPAEFPAEAAAGELRRLVAAYAGNIAIEVVSPNAAELQRLLGSGRQLATFGFSMPEGLKELASSLAKRSAGVLGLCHITQLVSPSWIQRAQDCFALDPTIAAITGMISRRPATEEGVKDPFFVGSRHARQMERYLVGYAPESLGISRDTNSGFLLMRAKLAEAIGVVPLLDRRYDRPKPMEEWVHEILMTLQTSGKRFEVVPDLHVDGAVEEGQQLEALGAHSFARAFVDSRFGPRGTDRWVAARLAVDASLYRERSRTAAKYRDALALGGADITPITAATTWDQHLPQLAKFAHASGRIDLAVDLAASRHIRSEDGARSTLRQRVESLARAIKLTAWVAQHRYETVNIPSNRISSTAGGRAFLIQVNAPAVGRATLLFPAMDLAGVRRFSCSVALQNAAGTPVRVRVDLVSPDRSRRHTAEKIVTETNATRWQYDIPPELRHRCDVIVGVEMADPRDSDSHPLVRIQDPVFL